MTKQTKFILAIAAQLLIILTIIIFKLAVLRGGTEILLLIEPVDPRSPLRGDYLTFRYEISEIQRAYFLDSSPGILPREGSTVYVPLKKGGKFWSVTDGVTTEKPRESKEIFIKGKISRLSRDDSTLRLVYGIEEYFIPEGKGAGLNLWDRNSKAFAKVVVDENGDAVLKQIYVDNQPWP